MMSRMSRMPMCAAMSASELDIVGCPVIFRISPHQGMSKAANIWPQKEDFFPLEDLDT